MTGFIEVARDVYVWRYPVLDVNTTLVVGDGAALVVDTLSTDAQAGQLADAVRAITPHPWTIVNTHHHFDHCFGNATLARRSAAPVDIWGHEYVARELRERGEHWRRRWYDEWLPSQPDLAEGLVEVDLLPPNRTLRTEAHLSIGGRSVDLYHLGRGHTMADVVVYLPDAGCLLAGDLVEEGAPPSFGDAYPLQWPETLSALHRTIGPAAVVVPGHGAVVDDAFARAQHDELTQLAWLIRAAHRDGAPAEEVAVRAPCGPRAGLLAARRGFAELDGRI